MNRRELKDTLRPSIRKLFEGLSFSDYFDDSVPADVKPAYSLTPMEEMSNSSIFINEMRDDQKNEFKTLLAELFKYLQDELKLKTIPIVILKSDQKNGDKILGKTGYYNPAKKEIVLFISSRHPKDILRSFAHEVIHHWQHEHDKLSDAKSGESGHDPKYAQNNPWLRQMEKQAYLLGNILFRDWEDNKKASDKSLQESVLKKKALREHPEHLFKMNWLDSSCYGPFIIYKGEKSKSDISYIYSNTRTDDVYLNSEMIESKVNCNTHGAIRQIVYNHGIDMSGQDYDNSIEGRIWKYKGKFYVCLWNTYEQIEYFGIDIFLKYIKELFNDVLHTDLNQVNFQPYDEVEENETSSVTYSYEDFKNYNSKKVDLEKQKKMRDLHLMDPMVKGDMLKQMGVKPKTQSDLTPDFMKRQLAGVDESILREHPESLMGNDYFDKTCKGPFIIFNYKGKTEYVYGNIDDNTVFVGSKEIKRLDSDVADTHGMLCAYLDSADIVDISNCDYNSNIYGRIWDINGTFYVATWNTVDQINKIGFDKFLKYLSELLSVHLNVNIEKVKFQPFDSKEPEDSHIVYGYKAFRILTGHDNAKDLEKQKYMRDLHLMNPAAKNKALKNMGAKPKVQNDTTPDFMKRQLVGVDEEKI